ncbi:hypothetical protein [Methylobacterium sp. J-068]|uniref:hypothetical protein n=1 Tax=Methylobacterium sp. J-068 TaxID=2836649 RepID=UPI001FBBB6C6|nr:hypothetical protein [Methylobacterium sp. J-068]MCJ2036467.1 hypothetical protein [Methylobacterium sp. J-068]
MLAQGAIFVGVLWVYFYGVDPPIDFHKEPRAILFIFFFAFVITALFTGIASALLRLATRAVRRIARSRGGPRVAQEPDQEALRIGGAGRLQEGPQIVCQTALNIDPGSASNFDPVDGYGGTPLISPAKRVGVAQPG